MTSADFRYLSLPDARSYLFYPQCIAHDPVRHGSNILYCCNTCIFIRVFPSAPKAVKKSAGTRSSVSETCLERTTVYTRCYLRAYSSCVQYVQCARDSVFSRVITDTFHSCLNASLLRRWSRLPGLSRPAFEPTGKSSQGRPTS